MSVTAPIANNANQPALDVLVVGAGFAGLYQLYRLRKLGFNVQVVEAEPDLGGVWQANRYPGARVDTHIPIYEFSVEDLWRDWNWSERFPGREELKAYFHYVDNKLDLSRDIRFNTRVTGMKFDADNNQWQVELNQGDDAPMAARFVVLSVGFAAKSFTPEHAGVEDFTGEIYHTAHWPEAGVEFKDKRIAVIGTGASGVQTVQEAAKVAAQVTVYQRTPILALPMFQKKLTAEEQAESKRAYPWQFARRRETFGGFDYDFLDHGTFDVTDEERQAWYEKAWAEGGFRFWLGTFNDMLMEPKANLLAYEFWRDKTRARIKDPVLKEKLAPMQPPHPFGVKRPSLEQWYYDIWDQDNMALVDVNETPIERITATGIQTSEGHREYDLIVWATGFDAVTGSFVQIDIHGTEGRTLRDKWGLEGASTYLGMTSVEFPNLFFMYGPQSPAGFCNGPTCAEYQGEVIVNCIDDMRRNGLTRIVPTAEAETEWGDHSTEVANMTLFPQANSWYMGANIPGKKRQLLNYAGGVPLYLQKCAESVENGYAGFVLS